MLCNLKCEVGRSVEHSIKQTEKFARRSTLAYGFYPYPFFNPKY